MTKVSYYGYHFSREHAKKLADSDGFKSAPIGNRDTALIGWGVHITTTLLQKGTPAQMMYYHLDGEDYACFALAASKDERLPVGQPDPETCDSAADILPSMEGGYAEYLKWVTIGSY